MGGWWWPERNRNMRVSLLTRGFGTEQQYRTLISYVGSSAAVRGRWPILRAGIPPAGLSRENWNGRAGARGRIGSPPGIFREDSTKTLKSHGRSFILRQVGNIYHKILTSLAHEMDIKPVVVYIGDGRDERVSVFKKCLISRISPAYIA